jgi:uncharacterized protein (TIGR02646 family)
MECDYDSLRRSPEVLETVEDGLFTEQGGICAYTGHQLYLNSADQNTGRTRDVEFHIEHLTPQNHCTYDQETEYTNLVACWPAPNRGFEPAYGARKKGNWPGPASMDLFVSPLRSDCASRFKFNHRGEITVAHGNDSPAEATIKKLGLDHHTLTELRREAIRGTLNPTSRPIKLTEARKLLVHLRQVAARLDAGQAIKLPPFCFAVETALEREIRKLKGILNCP